MVTCSGLLLGVEGDDGSHFFSLQLPVTFEKTHDAIVEASADGRFVAVVPRAGVQGVLVDTASGAVVKTLERTDYHANVSGWAVGFAGDVLIIATAWNVLEVFSLPSLEPVVRADPEGTTVDYFYGVLSVSPNQQRATTSGWVWHPIGSVEVFELANWFEARGQPKMCSLVHMYWWDGEVCWLDDHRVALFGEAGDGSEEFGEGLPYFHEQKGISLFEVNPLKMTGFLPCEPGRALGSDGSLVYLLDQTTRVYSLEKKEWLEPLEVATDVWHRGARVALSCPALHGLRGPCVLVWRASWSAALMTPALKTRALELQKKLTLEGLLVLADALEEAGAPGEAVAHCRERTPHGSRCWVVESLLI